MISVKKDIQLTEEFQVYLDKFNNYGTFLITDKVEIETEKKFLFLKFYDVSCTKEKVDKMNELLEYFVDELVKDNEIYYFMQDTVSDIEKIKKDFKDNLISFTEATITKPDKSLVRIKNSEDVKNAIKYWCNNNSGWDEKCFIITKDKTNVNTFEETLSLADVVIINIPDYLDYGFYIIYNKDTDLNVQDILSLAINKYNE